MGQWTNQRGLTSMVYKLLIKKTSDSAIKSENISNKELAEERHKPIFRKFDLKLIFYWQYLGYKFSRYAVNK